MKCSTRVAFALILVITIFLTTTNPVLTKSHQQQDSMESLQENIPGKVIYNRTYSIGTFQDVLQLPGGSIYTVGQTMGEDSDVFLARMDAEGDIVWKQTYDFRDSDVAKSLHEDSNGDFVVMGYTSNESNSDTNGDSDAIFMRVGSDGELIESSIINIDGKMIVNEVIETEDGGYLSVGSVEYDDLNHDLAIVKTNDEGEVEWKRVFSRGHYERITSVVQTRDKDFIATADIDSENLNSFNEGTAVIIGFTSTGTIQWTKQLTQGHSDASDIVKSNTGYVVGGSSGNSINRTAILWEIDPEGMVQKERRVGQNLQTISEIYRMPDGSHAVYAYRGDAFNSTYTILRMDSQWDVMWKTSIDAHILGIINSLTANDEGDILYFGSQFKDADFHGWAGKIEGDQTITTRTPPADRSTDEQSSETPTITTTPPTRDDGTESPKETDTQVPAGVGGNPRGGSLNCSSLISCLPTWDVMVSILSVAVLVAIVLATVYYWDISEYIEE